jgi:hypothetical protein
MESKLYSISSLNKIVLQEMNCKKIEAPEKGSILNIQIYFDLKLGDIKKNESFDVLMSLKIRCNEEGKEEDPRLFSLSHKIRSVYLTSDTKLVSEKNLTTDNYLFLKELFLLTREDINNALNKMNINFQLPYTLPDGIVNRVAPKAKKKKSKTKK